LEALVLSLSNLMLIRLVRFTRCFRKGKVDSCTCSNILVFVCLLGVSRS